MRNLVRWVLPGLLGANGLFMLLAPAEWYGAVPGVRETGPLNVHFVRDIGAAYVAAAVGLGWWAARRKNEAGVLLGAAVFLGLHMLVHMIEALEQPHPGSDMLRDFLGVYVPALITISLAWRALARGDT